MNNVLYSKEIREAVQRFPKFMLALKLYFYMQLGLRSTRSADEEYIFGVSDDAY